jgi:DHA1 family tetracycline resistance protein-like MFS transporter
MIGAAFGLGFIIGPATGGVLSQWGYALPAIVAAALVVINLTLVFFWLPESLTPERRANLPEKKPAVTLNALLNALKRPFTGPLLITRFFFGLAFAILQTIFALYALRKFGLEARDTGFILTYVGLISVFIQGYLVGKLTQVIQEDVLIFASIGIMAVSLLGWALAPSVWILLIVLAPISASGGILNTVLSSLLTKAVQPQEIGGILGLSASIESLTRVLAPTLGGILLGKLGAGAPGVFGAVILSLLFFYVWATILGHQQAHVQTATE